MATPGSGHFICASTRRRTQAKPGLARPLAHHWDTFKMATVSSEGEVVTIVFDPGMTVGDMTVRISLRHGAELRELLTQEGVRYSEIIELSQPAEILDALAPYLGGGGFVLLQTVLVQLIQRNSGKKFKLKIRDYEVEIDGYSASEVDEFMITLKAKSIEDAKAWDELNAGRHHNGAEEDDGDELTK